MAHLLAGIDRFTALAGYMQVGKVKAVATAAIREAENGSEFLAAAAERGLLVELINGEQEARAAAMGVLCCYPDADGYVADLGGGSLELARLRDGQISQEISLPLGTAKLTRFLEADWEDTAVELKEAIGEHIDTDKSLYMVGGTWRALAHFHQHLDGHPLLVLSRYKIAPREVEGLTNHLQDAQLVASVPAIVPERVPLMPAAARMLGLLDRLLQPKHNVACPLGIREGLLMGELNSDARSADPLLESARFAGQRLARDRFDGDRLFGWIQPIFEADEREEEARLRHAACLLADCAWHIHPDYRSAHALQIGLEGNFIGAGGRQRAIIARALWSAYGDDNNSREILSRLARRQSLRRADKWGLAIRLAMRIDGGTGMALDQCQLRLDGDKLLLKTRRNNGSLRGEAILHRLARLAASMGKTAAFADLD